MCVVLIYPFSFFYFILLYALYTSIDTHSNIPSHVHIHMYVCIWFSEISMRYVCMHVPFFLLLIFVFYTVFDLHYVSNTWPFEQGLFQEFLIINYAQKVKLFLLPSTWRFIRRLTNYGAETKHSNKVFNRNSYMQTCVVFFFVFSF